MSALNLVTPEEAAVTIGIPPWCLYKWIGEEGLPYGLAERFSPSMQSAVVSIDTVRSWIKKHHKSRWVGFGKRGQIDG